jgi:hypothetical protein
MHRFVNGIIAGAAVGLIAGAAMSFGTTDKQKRRMLQGGKRALRKCNHIIEDWM